MARGKLTNGLPVTLESFCLEFFRNGGHATNADRASYSAQNMSPKTANEKTSRLLAQDKIRARIENLRRNTAKRVEIQEADILRSAYRAMMVDPTLMLSQSGYVLPHNEWPEDLKLCIDGFEVKEIPGTKGQIVKVKFSSCTQARDQLMKYAGLFAQDNVQQRTAGLMNRLDDLPDAALDALEECLEEVIERDRTLN